MKSYSMLVNECIGSEEEAISRFKEIVENWYVFEDDEAVEQGNLSHCRFVDEIDDKELWYCYGADHYFIVQKED